MNCIRCGKTLDAEAQRAGACQYCGQAIYVQPGTVQIEPGTAPGSMFPNTGRPFVYSWRDWPATASPPTGNALPPLAEVNATQAPPAWESFNDLGNDRTEFGPSPLADSAVPPPEAEPFAPVTDPGTAPFTPLITPLNAPPVPAPVLAAPLPASGLPPPESSAPPLAGMTAPTAHLPATPARLRERRALILAAVGVFVVLALIVGGLLFARSFTPSPTGTTTSTNAQASPTPGPTAPKPATRVYHDHNGLFTISYPATWQVQSISQVQGATLRGVQFQGGNASLKVLTGQALPFDHNQAAQTDTLLLQLMGGHNITNAAPKRIGGQSWTTKQAETNSGDRLIAASITHKGTLYAIVYSAPKSAFSQDETKFFTPMLNSFVFGA